MSRSVVSADDVLPPGVDAKGPTVQARQRLEGACVWSLFTDYTVNCTCVVYSRSKIVADWLIV